MGKINTGGITAALIERNRKMLMRWIEKLVIDSLIDIEKLIGGMIK